MEVGWGKDLMKSFQINSVGSLALPDTIHRRSTREAPRALRAERDEVTLSWSGGCKVE
jgi:hypothetical protein